MSSLVGALELPVPAGTSNSKLADPTVIGLASFIAYALRLDLNDKLGAMLGMSADACPSTNVFTFDPDTYFVRESFPALYLWWPGQSKYEQMTHVFGQRTRELAGMYVFQETLAPRGMRSRAGLLAAADASIAKALDRGRYVGHTPDIAGAYDGQSIASALNLTALDYVGSTQVRMLAMVPESSAAPGGPPEGHVKTGYPALIFKIVVAERVFDDAIDSTVRDADVSFTLETNDGDFTDPLSLGETYLYAPSGPNDDE